MDNSLQEYRLIDLGETSSNLTEFTIFRNRENLNRPVFLIYSTNMKTIRTILDYLCLWINKPVKKVSTDLLNQHDLDQFNENNMYVINTTDMQLIKNESRIENLDCDETTLCHFARHLFENCGPMILVTDRKSGIPAIFNSVSNAVFIDDIPEWISLVNLENSYMYGKEDVIVVDGMTCWNKLSILKNIF